MAANASVPVDDPSRWPGAGGPIGMFPADALGETRLQAALTAGNVAAWYSNLQTRERWWSPEMFAIHGLAGRDAVPEDYLALVHAEDRALVQKRLDENRISLNLDKRKAEIDEEKARKEQRKAARAKAAPLSDKRFTITLDNASKPGLEAYSEKKEPKPLAERIEDGENPEDADGEAESKTVDGIRNETLNVLSDLVQLNHGPKTPQAVPTK